MAEDLFRVAREVNGHRFDALFGMRKGLGDDSKLRQLDDVHQADLLPCPAVRDHRLPIDAQLELHGGKGVQPGPKPPKNDEKHKKNN